MLLFWKNAKFWLQIIILCSAGTKFRDMKDYMKLSRRENLDQIILHVENINLDSDSTGDIATASR